MHLTTQTISTLLVALALLISFDGQSRPIQSLFDQANQYYQKNKYQKAIDEYKAILEQGYEAADLYYNLGNAYYKVDSVAHAILYYEKAKKLAPHHQGVQHNLKLAREQVVDEIDPLPTLFIVRWWRNLVRWQSAYTWAVLSTLLMWLAGAGGGLYLFHPSSRLKKWGFFSALIALLLSFFTLVLTYQEYQYETQQNQAIIFTNSVYIKSAPDKNSTDKFVLHEGTKVTLLDQINKWVKIRLADGKTGWMPVHTLRRI